MLVERNAAVLGKTGLSSPRWWRLPFTYEALPALAMLIDIAVIGATSLVSGVGYHFIRFGVVGDLQQFAGLAAIVAAVVVPALKLQKSYEVTELLNAKKELKVLVLSWIFCFVFLLGVAFALKIGHLLSRGAVGTMSLLGLVSLLAVRVGWSKSIQFAMARGALRGRKIALISAGDAVSAAYVTESLEGHGFDVSRPLFLHVADTDEKEALQRSLSDALVSLRGSDIEEVYVDAAQACSHSLFEALRETKSLPLPIHFLPDRQTAALLARPSKQIGEHIALEVHRAPLTLLERGMKRTFDLLFSGAALVALSPLLIGAAVIVRLESPGPSLFRQRRRGFNGREFTILKFRTMYVLEDGPEIKQATRGDRRVTRLGYWLRRTSIDELPQLLNVLKGEMSIVGPRPHAVAHDEHYNTLIGNYPLRHHLKPGLTGWAQVNGCRGETPTLCSMARRVELDLWYVDNWTFLLDLRIVARTVVELLRSPNAY